MQDRKGIATFLKAGPYRSAALVPATPWLGSAVPRAPRLSLKRANSKSAPDTLVIEPEQERDVSQFAIWQRYGPQWEFTVKPASNAPMTLVADATLGAPDAVVVSAVNRVGAESVRVSVLLQAKFVGPD